MRGKSRVVWLLDFIQIMKLEYPRRDEFWILDSYIKNLLYSCAYKKIEML